MLSVDQVAPGSLGREPDLPYQVAGLASACADAQGQLWEEHFFLEVSSRAHCLHSGHAGSDGAVVGAWQT